MELLEDTESARMLIQARTSTTQTRTARALGMSIARGLYLSLFDAIFEGTECTKSTLLLCSRTHQAV